MLLRYASVLLLSLVLASAPEAQEPELFTASASASAESQATDFPAGFYAEDAASGGTFDTPVALKVAPDGRIFVAEKRGRVYIIKDGQKLSTPFINIESEVLNSHDRGLLGMELDPDFAQNGHIYLLYTVDHDGTGDRLRKDVFGRLTRYTAQSGNPDRANTGSRRILIGPTFSTGIPACYYSHAPGTLAFGSDGTLLVGTGDGAHYNNTDSGGQDPECFGPGKFGPLEDIGAFRSLYLPSLAGKILRVDPSTGEGLPSNPFYTGNGADNESRVWAFGLRNPYRFDALQDGSTNPAAGDPGLLLVGDVGWQKWEELNVVNGGESFGWPCFEGEGPLASYQNANPSHSSCSETATTQPTPTKPDAFWHHLDDTLSSPAGRTGRAIVGGDMYEGTKYPVAYQGDFFYGDYPRGWVATGRMTGGSFSEDALFSPNVGAIVDFEYDPTSEHMLMVNVAQGRVIRLRHTDGDSNNPPVAQASGDVLQGSSPLTVQFSSAGTFDPDGDAFATRWTFGDGSASTQANPTHTFTEPGVYTVRLRVTDAFNVRTFTQLTVTVGGSAPVASIDAPEAGASGGVGQTVQLRGSAVDADAPPEALSYLWEVSQVHNDHEHFDVFTSTQQNTSFALTEHGNPEEVVYYTVKLTVTDASGLSDTVEQPFYVAPFGDGLPAPWAHRDIGPVQVGGNATPRASGGFAVEGGGDVWGNADAFHYAYRPMGGDGAITARLTDLTGVHPWAKVGLMIRSNLDRSAQHAMLVVTPARGVHLQYRPSQGASTVEAVGRDGEPPVWLRLQRTGDVITALTSSNGTSWATLGSVVVPMGTGVHVGLMASATDYEQRYDLASGVFANVTVGEVEDAPPPAELPAPWATSDIGPVTTPGSASYMSGAFMVNGSGDVWGTADAFRFVHQTLSGDGTLTARLGGLNAEYGWAKVGLMMRESLARGSRHAMLIVTPENGVHVQHRAASGGSTQSAAGPALAAPAWLRLVRVGSQITAFVSSDGAVWSIVSTVSVPMGQDIEVGMLSTSTDFEARGDLASGAFDSVTLSAETDPGGNGLPAPWLNMDIGPVAASGATTFDSGTFSVDGGGDTWGTADALHFAYQPVNGDATITARLTDVQAAHPWAKVGVMIRDGLARESAHATLFATGARGVHLQHRSASGASTQSISAPEAFTETPVWLQLQRSGDVLAASVSADGSAWETVASVSIPMGQTVYVGLSATSTDYEGRNDTAGGTFAQVMVDGQAGAAARPFTPEASLTAPEFALETIYPNPFRSRTTVRLALSDPGDYTVEVVDVLGRRVLSRDIREEASGVINVPLELGGAASGTYIVRVLDRERGRALVRQMMMVR